MSRILDDAILAELKNPFPTEQVKWRVGATNEKRENGKVVKRADNGIALAYIDSRDVQKRLDDVLGISNWRDTLTRVDEGFVCEIEIKIDGEWVKRSDAAGLTKVEPIKGGASDAFKRAAAKWGVGRYLYYLPNIWVALEPRGNSYILAAKPQLPEWAQPQKDLVSWEKILDDVAKGDTSGADSDTEANEDDARVEYVTSTIQNAESDQDLMKLFNELSPQEKKYFTLSLSLKKKELLNAVAK